MGATTGARSATTSGSGGEVGTIVAGSVQPRGAGGTLAVTGLNPFLGLLMGAALVAAGGAVTFAGRRRSHR
ncbi:MAG: hypothetical protein R2754_08415 [Microthrixaceae bacterium]